ncbi:MAG: hydrogenase maturation protein HypF [Desulfonauticus sp.]|nr:MAG: Acylphosphatase [Desulfonauticus sp. 38_4375]MDK2920505.1 hydrogenase maturation protein HypF [Desulfonauticus sp.]
MTRKEFIVNGRVQGVGFRPFIYKLAKELDLTGWVKNSSLGVVIEVQGEKRKVECFQQKLVQELPPLAEIVDLKSRNIGLVAEETDFRIVASEKGQGHNVLISPDVATCADCRKDIFNPENRRFLYPFTNCTNCGPRYTITRSIPYDRPQTSMACFPLCARCQEEYENPLDRRFHAQPNACPECGPEVWLVDREGKELARGREALELTAQLILKGKILALKGLGGFHLACEAREEKVVDLLRKRKKRPHKSLALMVENLEQIKSLCLVNAWEEKELLGLAHPIVVLDKKESSFLPDNISEDTNTLGIMLPYTPLHMLLFYFLRQYDFKDNFPVLVMTSGNSSSEPISLGNREAFSRLSLIADYFLFHNRDILIRCDDSVVRMDKERRLFFRKARGYVPTPIFLSKKGESILGVGPELKNTICFLKDNQAFVSQHIGDLKNLETYEFFLEIVKHLENILEVSPKAVVRDLHPDYLSSSFAQEYAKEKNIPLFSLQHHYAHLYALLAEHKLQTPLLGWAVDGTGLGEDGNIWGGELLYVEAENLERKRLVSFSPLPLPGGEKAVLEPWRIALGVLWLLQEDMDYNWPWKKYNLNNLQLLFSMLEKQINTPWSSSLGRIFDGVAALLGLVKHISYEGQAAIRLEKIQDVQEKKIYTWKTIEKEDLLVVDTLFLFQQIIRDIKDQVSPAQISRRFHLTIAQILTELGVHFAKKMGVEFLGFSGGVMQNISLNKLLISNLTQKQVKLLLHQQLPPNDGCISLGQAYFGRLQLEHV